MRETQRNIRTYKKKLIGLKEKLATAGLLFLMSAVMLTTASFAWITLSINPEIKGIETTIAGNGNLEIALASSDANGNVLEPDESQVGDGAIQDLLLRNITWGNLVNLNDMRYGIQNAILKPSALNKQNLVASPLEAVEYSRDGRIVKKNFNFKYTSYNSNLNNGQGDFEFTPVTKYGVRAISSVHEGSDNTEATNIYNILTYLLNEINTEYKNTIENNKSAISNVMGVYVSDKANSMLGGGSPLNYRKHIPDMITLMNEFIECMNSAFMVYDQIAQAQYYSIEELQSKGSFPYTDIEQLKSLSERAVSNVLPEMSGLDELIAMYNRTVKNRDSLVSKYNDTETYPTIIWANISGEINALVNIATCEIQTSKGNLTVGSISKNDITTLMGMLSGNYNDNRGVVKGGDIKNFEVLTGGRMNVNVDITIDKNVTMVGGRTVKANVQTDADLSDFDKVDTMAKTIDNLLLLLNDGAPAVWIADDTYGMVLDFYLRTNAKDSYVVLEGKTIFDSLVSTILVDGTEYVLFYNVVDNNTYYYVPDKSNKYTGEQSYSKGISNEELQIMKSYGDFISQTTGQVISFIEEKSALPAVKFTYDSDSSTLSVEKVTNASYYLYSINDNDFEILSFNDGETKALISVDENTFTVTVVAASETEEYWASKTIWDKESNTAVLQPTDPQELNKVRKEFVNNLEYVEKKVVTGYDGENRIWQESSDIPENSTTQGNGSCYVFYPNDPIEQQQMLQLLKGLSVAFIDEDSQLLSIAVLNTENVYEENGKVTVPLELKPVQECKYFLPIKIEKEEKYVVTSLENGKAKLISAIVYLDGEKVTNQDVSSINDITGNLNIQFGSTEKLNHVEDEKLKYEVYTLSAGMNGNGSKELELKFDSNSLPSTTVELLIDGLKPNNVKANFSRIVNNSQGVKGDDIIFTYNSETKYWEGNVSFDRPGNYVLRSIWVDGIEYELTNNEKLIVNIDGFSVAGIDWSENSSVVYKMTSDYTYTVNSITAKFASANTYVPESVQVLFRNTENNTYVTVDLSDNGDQSWSGKASFTNSSTYVLDTLLIDNEAHTVDTSFRKTITLFLGIHANIDIKNNMYVYEGSAFEVPVSALIFDGTGAIMSDLNNVYLRYNKTGSITPLFASLKWNEANQAYEGTFRLEEPGKYEFYSVGINKTIADITDENQMDSLTSYLYSAKAPSLTMIPKEPPVYVGYEMDEIQFKPNENASFNITISNSSAATGAVKLYHEQSKTEHIVEIPNGNKTTSADGSMTIWKVDIPKQTSSSQNGTWTLKDVYLSDVYVNETMYQFEGDEGNTSVERWNEANNNGTEEEGGKDFIILSNVPEVTTYIVNDLNVYVSNIYSNPDTKDPFEKVEFTTTLDNPYSRTNTVNVTDFYDNDISKYISIDSSTKISYSYTHDGSWTNYADIIDTAKANPANGYEQNSSGDFVATTSFYYEGIYVPTLTLVLKNEEDGSLYTYSITNGTNGITVSYGTSPDMVSAKAFISNELIEWIQPDAVFTKVSPSEKHWVSSDWSWDGGLFGAGAHANASATGYKKNLIVDYDENLNGGHHIEVWFEANVSNRRHVHTEECYISCTQLEHSHSTSCYDGVGSVGTPGGTLPENLRQGLVYYHNYTTGSGCNTQNHTDKYIYIGTNWYVYSGNVSDGQVAGTNSNCPGGHEHTTENGCYTCPNDETVYYNRADFVSLSPSYATVKLLNVSSFQSATILIDSGFTYSNSSGQHETDFSFVITDTSSCEKEMNIGTVDADGYYGGVRKVVGHTTNNIYSGAKGKYVDIKLNDGNTYSFELKTPLTINENEGSADGYY